jgi:SAM-dependent methyltransferase
MNTNELILMGESFCAQGKYKEALGCVNVGLIKSPRNQKLVELFLKIPSQYDSSFYDDAYKVSYASACLFFAHLLQTHEFNKVVDVGAGVGAWSHAAVDLGKDVVSIDGEWVRDLKKPCSTLKYVFKNLNEEVVADNYFDLVVCVEVAEHLMPDRSVGFVSDLCKLAPVIIFGAALPRQGGSGHINCRPHSYWVDLFDKNDYVAFDAFRPKFWYCGDVGPWYAQNTYLYVDKKMVPIFESIPRPSLFDVYHPRVVLDSPICLNDHLNGRVDPVEELM